MGLNWLITGGCGFIGSCLVKRLQEQEGNRIRVVDNLSVGTRKDLAQVCQYVEKTASELDFVNSDVELVVGDIGDAELAQQAARGVDVIVHLAANTGVGPSVEDPRGDCYNNVIGTLNYLEAARANHVGRFVFASSGAPVGEVVPPIHEEIAPHPVSPYGASKLAGEGYCSAYFHSYGVGTIGLRFGNVYGPGSLHKHSVVAKFIRQALAGEVLEIYGDGTQTRDFIYIDDLVDAILLAAEQARIGGEIFQIASCAEVTINELVDELNRAFVARSMQPARVVNAAPRTGDVMRNYSDTSKAKQQLGWQSDTSLQDGLQHTIDYFLR